MFEFGLSLRIYTYMYIRTFVNVYMYVRMYLWRFSGHLDPSLKDGDWEAGVRGTTQPQSKVLVRCVNLGRENAS